MKPELEKILKIAYEVTHNSVGGSRVFMTSNRASNMSKYKQTFSLIVMPSYNQIPKPSKRGGTIVSSAIGYKELTLWVYFGDNKMWAGPDLKWLYMDRSTRWDGSQKSGGLDDLDELKEISDMLKKEAEHILKIELDYRIKHGSLDGLLIDGYALVD